MVYQNKPTLFLFAGPGGGGGNPTGSEGIFISGLGAILPTVMGAPIVC
ncbi:MAG: hypothetical protein AABX24_02085 [Nanoarchaeota archaeon]